MARATPLEDRAVDLVAVRLTVRYERKGSHFLAFLSLAAALTCYKKLAQLAT